MEPEMTYDPSHMPGLCEVCLRPECGADGYVHLPGTPIQIGRVCVTRLWNTLVGSAEQTSTGTADAQAVAVVVDDSRTSCPDCGRAFGGPAALGSHRRAHRRAA